VARITDADGEIVYSGSDLFQKIGLPLRGTGGVYIECMATSTDTPEIPADVIVKTPGVCSGQPRIAGTRIKVKHVYTWVGQMKMTPAQVVAEYPHLTLAQVHAALAYYHSHVDEIQQDIANEEKLVAELKAKSGPSRLAERMAEIDAADDSLSSG
jgi:uncharacterized protein (DUF433 family)